MPRSAAHPDAAAAPPGEAPRAATPATPLCFESAAHPGDARAAALVYSRAMAPPLAATLVPLMLFALTAALTGGRLWPYFFWAGPPAVAVAWGWARFQLGRVVAEVRVRPEEQAAAVRSVGDVLRGAAPVWHHAARLRVEREGHAPVALRLDLGDTSHRLLLARWPQADALTSALQRAVASSG